MFPLPKGHIAFNVLSPMMLTDQKRANHMKALLLFNKCASRAVRRCFAPPGRTTCHAQSFYQLYMYISVAFKGTSQNISYSWWLPHSQHGPTWNAQAENGLYLCTHLCTLEITQSWPDAEWCKIRIGSKHGLQRKDMKTLLPALGGSDSFVILFCLAFSKTTGITVVCFAVWKSWCITVKFRTEEIF